MMHLLRISATTAITEAVLETMVEHANVWSSMQVLQPMADLILAQLHHANSAQSPVAQHASASLVRALVAMGAVPAKAAESLSHSARRSSWPGSPSPPQGAEVHNALASLMADTEASEPHLVSAELLKRHGPSKALIDAAWAAVTTSLRSRPEDDCSRYVELLAYLCVDCSSTFNKPFQDWASAATREGVDAQDNSISQAHIQLIVGLTMKGLLASNVVLESLLLPHMSRIAAKGALSADESKSERDHWPTIAALINALLLARPSGGLQLSVVEQHSLRAQRAILFQKHSFSLVVRLLAMLATIDVTSQPVVAQLQPDPNEVRAALCDMTLVKVAAQKDPAGFARSLDEGTSVTGLAGQTTAIDRIFQALDADSLLARPCLEIQCAKVTSRLDPWRTRWTMVEMRYIVDSLQAVPPSQLVRADAKLAALAECLFEPLLGDGNASLMSDLLPTGTSNALVSKLAAAGLTQVLETLTQTSTPRSIGEIAREDERIGKLLRALIRILKRTENYVLPAVSGDTAERVLLCVVERFEGAQRGSVDGAELFPSLRLLHLLLRFEGLWTHTAKTLAGRLQNVLIKLATGYGHDCEDEATFVALIDTVAYIQDELPADAKASAAAMLNPILNSTPNTSASPEPGQLLALPLPQPNVVRLQRLLPYVTQNPFVRDLVMADSARAAILHGQCSPAPDKPWEWLDHLDSPSTQTQGGRCDSVAATATATATASSSSVQASASASAPAVPSSGNAIVPLQNVGSLSLSSFAAQKTRDRVPSPEIEIPQIPASPSTDDRPVADSRTAWRFLESERTYGDWMGGEPIYARDMRRGFVDTSAYAYVLESGSHHSDEEQQQQQSLETNTDMNTNASTNTRKGKSQDRDSKEKLNAAADNKLIDLTGEDDREQPAAAPPAQPAAGSSSSSSRKRKDPPAGAAFAAAKKAASKPKARRKKTG